jgi:hypothetical protein
MSSRRLRFLVVFDTGLWSVCEVGSGQSLASFATCDEAVRNARYLAERTAAELLVMNPDGTVASRETCALRETA